MIIAVVKMLKIFFYSTLTDAGVADDEVWLPPKTLAWCQRTLAEIGFSGLTESGHFITKGRRFQVPWYYKALLRSARELVVSGSEMNLAPEDRNLALLDSIRSGYQYEPTAAVVRAWEADEGMDIWVQQIENGIEDQPLVE